MTITIAQYIRFRTKDGQYIPGYSFQNLFVGETRTFDGIDYRFAPFAYNGTIGSRGNETPQAALILVPDELTMSIGFQAGLERWLVDVKCVSVGIYEPDFNPSEGSLTEVDPDYFAEISTISNQLWTCGATSVSDTVSIPLGSALDATRRTFPRAILTEAMIGSAPPTASIVSATD